MGQKEEKSVRDDVMEQAAAAASARVDEAEEQAPGVIDLSAEAAEFLSGLSSEELDAAQAEVERLKAEAVSLTAEVEEWKAKAYRSAADLQNFRRRNQQAQEEQRKFGNEGLLKAILPVADNLERAAEHAGDDPVFDGVRMVIRQLNQVLSNYNARSFDAMGQPFDPQVHEAMSQVESAEHPPNTVVQVFQRGWKLYDRLVRPAMVIVSKAPVAPVKLVEPDEPEIVEAEAIEAEVVEAEAIEAEATEPEVAAPDAQAEAQPEAPEVALEPTAEDAVETETAEVEPPVEEQ